MKMVKIRDLIIGEGLPKICVPMAEAGERELLRAAKACVESAGDLAEWRADCFREAESLERVLSVLSSLRKKLEGMPLLFTFRTKPEGGERELAKRKYEELLLAVSESGCADLIDVEAYRMGGRAEALIRRIQETGCRVIASSHEFESTPSKYTIVERLCAMEQMGADLVKIAVMPSDSGDVLTLLEAVNEMKEHHNDRPVAAMSMSGLGTVSRLCGEIFGSALTFGTAGRASAPGQPAAEEVKQVQEILHKHKKAAPAGRPNVFLTGFMGVGKSTVARELSRLTGCELVELDRYIEEKQGMKITDIFEQYGEETFRELESQALADMGRHPGRVVSCGGGIVLREKNAALMKQSGRVVCLTARPETVFERVRDSRERPLLNRNMSVESISGLMEERRAKYEAAADFMVSTDGRDAAEICREILERL